MEKKIIELIAKQLNKKPETITLTSNFLTDLKADSLDILEMLMTLEDEFSIEIADEDIAAIKTVGDLVKYISSRK